MFDRIIVEICYKDNKLIIRDYQLNILQNVYLDNSPSCLDLYKDKLLIGYSNGLLEIYSINNFKLINTIEQSTIRSIIQGRDEGHLANNTIDKVSMINSHSLISLDNSNKLFYTSFRGIQQLKWLDGLDKVRLYGNYNTQKQSDKSIILDVLTFNDLVAILTPSKLIIISLSPTPSIIHRILNTSYTPSTHGNLSFNNNNLIFNWSNTLYKVCISDTITSTHHLLHLHITSCHWIKNIILIQSPTHLHLIHPDTFNVLESHPLYTPTQSQFQVLDKASYYVVSWCAFRVSLLTPPLSTTTPSTNHPSSTTNPDYTT